ncbi:MAG: hypothetical protein ACYTGH_20275, partial [Planctomycetota bacterium]
MIDSALKDDCIASIQRGTDWLARHQLRHAETESTQEFSHYTANYGAFFNPCEKGFWLATQWMDSFTLMALEASAALTDDRHRQNIVAGQAYLKSLQNLAPGAPERHGLIAEFTPTTSWCYVRDSVSAAWAFLALYQRTNEAEYLDRAKAMYNWMMTYGLDEEGFPLSGAIVHPEGDDRGQLDLLNHLQGNWHGGTLNLFYQLYRATGDERYIGTEYRTFLELFLAHNAAPEGNFVIYNKEEKASEVGDLHAALHKINDDFTTIGYLAAFRVTGEEKYLEVTTRYLDWVAGTMEGDRLSGHLSGVPVVLNLLLELEQAELIQERHAALIPHLASQILEMQSG